MTESLLLSTDVGNAFSLREMAYAWEDDPSTPEGARSLEDLLTRALQLASGLQGAWSLATEEGKVWESDSYLRRIQAIDILAKVVVDMLTRTREILATARVKYPNRMAPPREAEVKPSLEAARGVATKSGELLQWLNRTRPPVNEVMLQRSRDAYAGGAGEPVSEIIARLANGGPLVKE